MDPRSNETGDIADAYGAKIEALDLEDLQKQEAGYVYRYRYNGGASSQVWLSHGRQPNSIPNCQFQLEWEFWSGVDFLPALCERYNDLLA